MSLTDEQRDLVARKIRVETILKQKALAKRRMGKKLSLIEIRRIKRPRAQIIRIGFEKAREEDETIPEFEKER